MLPHVRLSCRIACSKLATLCQTLWQLRWRWLQMLLAAGVLLWMPAQLVLQRLLGMAFSRLARLPRSHAWQGRSASMHTTHPRWRTISR